MNLLGPELVRDLVSHRAMELGLQTRDEEMALPQLLRGLSSTPEA